MRSTTRDLKLSSDAGFWAVAFAFLVTMAFSALPTPLYVLYQQRDHFSTLTITIVFAVYGVGVIAALFLLGHVSDWVGRRRALIAAVLLNAVSGLIFIASPALASLLVARAISGVSVGVATATATAYITELHRQARPGASARRAESVATLVNLGGIGLGPLVAGILAQWAPDPLRLPFIVVDVLLVVAAIAVAATPETRPAIVPRPRYRPQRVQVLPHHRALFYAAAAGILVATATMALFNSVSPTFLAGTLGHHSHALAGAVSFLGFASAALAQLALARVAPRIVVVAGFVLLPVGLALLTIAIWTASLAPFLVGGIVAGAGAGLLFKGTLSTTIEIAPADSRAETLAGLFLASYIGLVVPAVGLGVALQHASARASMTGFAALTLLSILASARPLLARRNAPAARAALASTQPASQEALS